MAKFSFTSGMLDSYSKDGKYYVGAKVGGDKLVDTSGFIPLDIRMKQIDIANMQRKLALASYDYHETEELYDDDIIPSPYDDISEIKEKIDLYNQRKRDFLAAKYAEFRSVQEKKKAEVAAEKSIQKTEQKTSSPVSDE